MRLLANQPKGVLALTILETADALVYFGLLVSLVLFLVKHAHLNIHQAYIFYGIYLTLIYSLPLLGGYIADRFIGAHRAILYGAILIIIGCLILAIDGIHHYKLGFAATICGVGLFKASTPGLLGKLYDAHNATKENGFTLFYAGMNFGAIIGPVAFGLASSLLNWSAGFLTYCLFILMALIFYASQYKVFARLDTQSLCYKKAHMKWKVQLLCLAIISVMVICTTLIFDFPSAYRWIMAIFIITVVSALIRLLRKQAHKARKRLMVLILVNILNMCFFIAELQMGGSLTIFINHQINRTLWGWHIPTELLTALLPLFVAIGIFTMSPYFMRLEQAKIHNRLFLRILAGMLLGGLSFTIFSLTALHYNHSLHIGLIGIAIAYFFLGSGEINIGPMINAATTYLAPTTLQSTFMGIYYLFTAFAGYLASQVSNLTTANLNGNNPYQYSYVFMMIAAALFIVSILCVLCYPLIKKGINIR